MTPRKDLESIIDAFVISRQSGNELLQKIMIERIGVALDSIYGQQDSPETQQTEPTP